MTAALTFIASCVIGALVIETADRVRIRMLMHRRVAELMLPHDTCGADRHAEQPKSNNCKQDAVHRFISFARIG